MNKSVSNNIDNNQNEQQTPSISGITTMKHKTNLVESAQHSTMFDDLIVSVSEPITKETHIFDEDCANFGHTKQNTSIREFSNWSILNVDLSLLSQNDNIENS